LRHITPIFMALGFSVAATSLCAAPAMIKDCEKIQEADAYNRCLAGFGPVAHEHHLMPVPAGANQHTYAHRHWHRITIVQHGRRKRMILSVDPNAAD
jgi:hypothetical protein